MKFLDLATFTILSVRVDRRQPRRKRFWPKPGSTSAGREHSIRIFYTSRALRRYLAVVEELAGKNERSAWKYVWCLWVSRFLFVPFAILSIVTWSDLSFEASGPWPGVLTFAMMLLYMVGKLFLACRVAPTSICRLP